MSKSEALPSLKNNSADRFRANHSEKSMDIQKNFFVKKKSSLGLVEGVGVLQTLQTNNSISNYFGDKLHNGSMTTREPNTEQTNQSQERSQFATNLISHDRNEAMKRKHTLSNFSNFDKNDNKSVQSFSQRTFYPTHMNTKERQITKVLVNPTSVLLSTQQIDDIKILRDANNQRENFYLNLITTSENLDPKFQKQLQKISDRIAFKESGGGNVLLNEGNTIMLGAIKDKIQQKDFQPNISQNVGLQKSGERQDITLLAQWYDEMLNDICGINYSQFSDFYDLIEILFKSCIDEVVRQMLPEFQSRGDFIQKLVNGFITINKQFYEQKMYVDTQMEWDYLNEITRIHKMYQKKLEENTQIIQKLVRDQQAKDMYMEKLSNDNIYLRKKIFQLEDYNRMIVNQSEQMRRNYFNLNKQNALRKLSDNPDHEVLQRRASINLQHEITEQMVSLIDSPIKNLQLDQDVIQSFFEKIQIQVTTHYQNLYEQEVKKLTLLCDNILRVKTGDEIDQSIDEEPADEDNHSQKARSSKGSSPLIQRQSLDVNTQNQEEMKKVGLKAVSVGRDSGINTPHHESRGKSHSVMTKPEATKSNVVSPKRKVRQSPSQVNLNRDQQEMRKMNLDQKFVEKQISNLAEVYAGDNMVCDQAVDTRNLGIFQDACVDTQDVIIMVSKEVQAVRQRELVTQETQVVLDMTEQETQVYAQNLIASSLNRDDLELKEIIDDNFNNLFEFMPFYIFPNKSNSSAKGYQQNLGEFVQKEFKNMKKKIKDLLRAIQIKIDLKDAEWSGVNRYLQTNNELCFGLYKDVFDCMQKYKSETAQFKIENEQVQMDYELVSRILTKNQEIFQRLLTSYQQLKRDNERLVTQKNGMSLTLLASNTQVGAGRNQPRYAISINSNGLSNLNNPNNNISTNTNITNSSNNIQAPSVSTEKLVQNNNLAQPQSNALKNVGRSILSLNKIQKAIEDGEETSEIRQKTNTITSTVLQAMRRPSNLNTDFLSADARKLSNQEENQSNPTVNSTNSLKPPPDPIKTIGSQSQISDKIDESSQGDSSSSDSDSQINEEDLNDDSKPNMRTSIELDINKQKDRFTFDNRKQEEKADVTINVPPQPEKEQKTISNEIKLIRKDTQRLPTSPKMIISENSEEQKQTQPPADSPFSPMRQLKRQSTIRVLDEKLSMINSMSNSPVLLNRGNSLRAVEQVEGESGNKGEEARNTPKSKLNTEESQKGIKMEEIKEEVEQKSTKKDDQFNRFSDRFKSLKLITKIEQQIDEEGAEGFSPLKQKDSDKKNEEFNQFDIQHAIDNFENNDLVNEQDQDIEDLRMITNELKMVQITNSIQTRLRTGFSNHQFATIATEYLEKAFQSSQDPLNQNYIYQTISQVYSDMIKQVVLSNIPDAKPYHIHIYLYQYLINNLGVSQSTMKKYMRIISTCIKLSKTSNRIALFTKFLVGEYDLMDLNYFLDCLVNFDETNSHGMTLAQNTDEQVMVNWIRVAQCKNEMFSGMVKSDQLKDLDDDLNLKKMRHPKNPAKFVIELEPAIQYFIKYYQLIKRKITIEYSDIFDFGDYEKRDCLRFDQFKWVYQWIENTKYEANPGYEETIFNMEADLVDLNGAQMMSLMRFTLVSMDYHIFSLKTQQKFIGADFKNSLKNLASDWNKQKKEIKMRFMQMKQYDMIKRQMIKSIDDFFLGISKSRPRKVWMTYILIDRESKALIIDSVMSELISNRLTMISDSYTQIVNKKQKK